MDPRGGRAVTAAHQAQGSWARCCHFVIIEGDKKQKWQKPAGRWIQLDSESSDMRLRKGGDGADSRASKLHS